MRSGRARTHAAASREPTRRPSAGTFALSRLAAGVLGAILALHGCGRTDGLAAQTEEAVTGSPTLLCWQGRPIADCRHFAVVEVQVDVPVLSSSRTESHPSRSDREIKAFGHGLEWSLGLMRNVSDDWAIGGTFSVGTGSIEAGVRGRARRWLGPAWSAEVEIGAVGTGLGEPWGRSKLWGPTVGARLNAGDHASVLLRWDGVHAPAGRHNERQVEAGFEQGLYVGASLGHTWAVLATATLGGLAWWLAAFCC